ncbi:MAG: Nif3-like dinuclear metal center hexameric protein, partial [Firmicutes bacterium]|nr:Nif3-like dinuclear metal center hexameric protein [Bacillota bacterium]
MPVPAAKVISIVETWAPRRLAEDWDNPGWQVGDPRAQVQKVLVALDASPEVLARAQEIGAELIITHHPLVFRPLKHLRNDMPEEAHVAAFLRAGVAVYSAHTNLDHATGGT